MTQHDPDSNPPVSILATEQQVADPIAECDAMRVHYSIDVLRLFMIMPTGLIPKPPLQCNFVSHSKSRCASHVHCRSYHSRRPANERQWHEEWKYTLYL
jgi:hypothetical protein